MKNQILETIRREIISRIDKRHLSAQAKNELVSVLSFLDSLESEKPIDGLEEEIDRIVKCEKEFMNFKFKSQLIGYIARHFAQWQKEKDERTLRKFFNDRNQGDASFYDLLAYREGHRDGMDEQKEQMMKEARNHFVLRVLSDNTIKKMIELYNDEVDCKFGDRVRIIIVKEEKNGTE